MFELENLILCCIPSLLKAHGFKYKSKQYNDFTKGRQNMKFYSIFQCLRQMKIHYLFLYFSGDICDPNPCKNGGVCSSGLSDNSFSCECPDGFTDPNCSSVVEVGKCKI